MTEILEKSGNFMGGKSETPGKRAILKIKKNVVLKKSI